MKTCRKCNKEKPLNEYYKHNRMLDGHLNICKDCVRSRVLTHREANIERIRAYDKQRAMTPTRVQARKEYLKTEAGKLARKNAHKNYREKHTERYFAQKAFGNALRDGRVVPQPCLICGNEKVEGHHPDYSRPLDVVWLCNKHHRETHKVTL